MKIQKITPQYLKQTNNRRRSAISYKTKPHIEAVPAFEGKNKYAKTLGGLFAAAGMSGAVMCAALGTLTLPVLLLSAAIPALSGVIIGHEFDKYNNSKH